VAVVQAYMGWCVGFIMYYAMDVINGEVFYTDVVLTHGSPSKVPPTNSMEHSTFLRSKSLS
jgi:hypothetical protein